MNPHIKKIKWDSDFFNIKIGEVYFNKNKINQSVKDFDLLICKNFEFKIDGFKNKFQETKYIFTKELANIDSDSDSDSDSEIIDYDYLPQKKNLFQQLAYESGKYSRFKLDNNFKTEDFYKLYDKWIENSINKSFADKIFYILNEEQLIGFVTLKKEKKHASIGLISVLNTEQGKGLGKKLIKKVEHYCLSQNLKILKIPTQKKNKNACSFYSKLGYKLTEQTQINHFWNLKNDTI